VSASAPDPLAAARLERRVLAAIVASSLLLTLLGIHWGLPNLESWNGDDISPDKPLRVVHDWLRGAHKYPYLHWWLNLGLYAPWLAGVAAAGQLDLGCLPKLKPECFAHPFRDMTVFMLLSRLLSAAMAVGIVLATRRLALVLHGDRAAALFAALICAWSPVLVFFGHTANLDAPHVFWFTASLVAAVRVWQRGAPLDYAAFGLLAGCAIATKDPIVGAYVLPGLALLAVHAARVRRESAARGAAWLRAALLDRRLLVLAALVVGLYALVQNALFNFEGLEAHFRSWTDASPVLADLRARNRSFARFLWRFLVSLEAELGAPMLALCAAGLLYAARTAPRTLVLALPLLSYAAFALLPAFVEPRLVLPLLPLLAVWGGCLAARLLRARGPLRTAGAALLALIFSHEFMVSLNGDLQMLNDTRYEAEAWLADQVPRGTRFAAFGGSKFLPRLERMGYEARWFAPGETRPGALEESGLEWAILSETQHPLADRSYVEEMRAGRRGYAVMFDSAGGHVLPPWFETRFRIGLVSPRITVLRRLDAQRPGTAKR
jgi:hypothetical protein